MTNCRVYGLNNMLFTRNHVVQNPACHINYLQDLELFTVRLQRLSTKLKELLISDFQTLTA